MTNQFTQLLTTEAGAPPAAPLPRSGASFALEIQFVSTGTFTLAFNRVNNGGNTVETIAVSFQVVAVAAPVTWTKSLTSKPFGERLQLNWSVAEQIDVAGYELERMYDGGAFEKVGEIAYRENGSREVDYAATVSWPARSAYYRIKQLDHAGTFDYSNTIFVRGSDDAVPQFQLFPNPATDVVRMVVPEGIRSIDLISVSGRIVRSYAAAEVNLEGMDVSAVAAGVYLVRPVGDGAPAKTQRLVVNH